MKPTTKMKGRKDYRTWWRKEWQQRKKQFFKDNLYFTSWTITLWACLPLKYTQSDNFDCIVEQEWAIREGLA